MNRARALICLTLLIAFYNPKQTNAQETKASLLVLSDPKLPRGQRREALASLLDNLHGPSVQPLLDCLWRNGVLDAVLDANQSSRPQTLESRLAVRPEFVRFLGAAFQHPVRQMRSTAIAWSHGATWPWLLRRRIRAYLAETNLQIRREFLASINGGLKVEEIGAVCSSRQGLAEEVGALFRLGLQRAPMTQRVQAWPGNKDWGARGFSNNRSHRPYRLMVGQKVTIPCPLSRRAVILLCGIKRTSLRIQGVMTARIGTIEVGKFAVGLNQDLDQVFEIKFEKSKSLVGKDIVLEFSKELENQVSFRALVAISEGAEQMNIVAAEKTLGAEDLEESSGLKMAKTRTGGLVVSEGEGHLVIQIPKYSGMVTRIDVDHWTPKQEPAVWVVTLNGQPLVRLISQRLPRTGKCFPKGLKLRPGRNELVFSRVSGGDLYVEAIRFVR